MTALTTLYCLPRHQRLSTWLQRLLLSCSAVLLAGCGTQDRDEALLAAEKFIDAFYSFDPQVLAAAMDAGEDEAHMLYYQSWAQAANYQIQTRHPCTRDVGRVVCRITVTDDFGGTLGYVTTDTFTLTVDGAEITAVYSEGDDPPIFDSLFEWIGKNRPEVMTGPCRDMFAGGTTPAECAKAVIRSARDFMAASQVVPPPPK